jgi:hypothetical protein
MIMDISNLSKGFRRAALRLNVERRVCTPRAQLNWKSPFQLLHPTRDPPFKYFKAFGAHCTVLKTSAELQRQGKLEARLDEAIKNSQSVPEQTAQQVDAKGQVLAKQVKGMDSRLQQQANTLKTLSSQLQNLQGAVGETGGLKREMDAIAKLQRDRQSAETTASTQAAAATVSAARQREKMIQYPRVQQDATPSGSAGVLSIKP